MAVEITREEFTARTGIDVENCSGVTLYGWENGHNLVLGTYLFVDAPGKLSEIDWLEKHIR